MARDGLGMSQEAKFHSYVVTGMANSIFASGDGKSPETSYVVIAIYEEYMILSILGIQDTGQQVTKINGQQFNIFEGVDGKTN